jgi:hypothetical protein
MTKITLNPLERGSPSIKSKEISNHTLIGIDKGWRRPVGWMVSILLRWKISHSLMKFLMSAFMPFQLKLALAQERVLWNPELPV